MLAKGPGIYMIKGPGAVYVGETENLRRRSIAHRRDIVRVRRLIGSDTKVRLRVLARVPVGTSRDRRRAIEREWIRHFDQFCDVISERRGGIYHPGAKLTVEDVIDIRRRFAAGETSTSLSEEFKVSPSTIGATVHGRNWANLPVQDNSARPNVRVRGSRSPWTSLDEDDVQDIKRRIQERKETLQAIADDYGVSRACIANIKHGRNWTHVSQ